MSSGFLRKWNRSQVHQINELPTEWNNLDSNNIVLILINFQLPTSMQTNWISFKKEKNRTENGTFMEIRRKIYSELSEKKLTLNAISFSRLMINICITFRWVDVSMPTESKKLRSFIRVEYIMLNQKRVLKMCIWVWTVITVTSVGLRACQDKDCHIIYLVVIKNNDN